MQTKVYTSVSIYTVSKIGGNQFMNISNQNEQIDGQSIQAYQLGKTDRAWQNGYGTQSDGQDTNGQNQPARKLTTDAKSIIIYFSRSGSTELLASKIARATNTDVLEIVMDDSYPANYQETLARVNYERENQDYPEVKMQVPDLGQYDTVYLGYQIWAMTLSHPTRAFLSVYGSQLSGKLIAPFMSQGGYGQGDSVQQIQAILREQGASGNRFANALVVDGNKVDQADARVTQWVKQIRS